MQRGLATPIESKVCLLMRTLSVTPVKPRMRVSMIVMMTSPLLSLTQQASSQHSLLEHCPPCAWSLHSIAPKDAIRACHSHRQQVQTALVQAWQPERAPATAAASSARRPAPSAYRQASCHG